MPTRLRTTTLVAALSALLSLPAAGASAQSTGGTEYGDGATTAGGSSLLSRRSELLGGTLTFKGVVADTSPGDTVEVQRLDRRKGWVPTTTATVGDDGSFVATWTTSTIGRIAVRAAPVRDGIAQSAAVGPTREVTVFKPAVATFYGPGLYGRRTACGQKLTKSLLGVAHRKLRCGTQVDLFYKGRTITVPVVDRGPFRAGTSWDLTSATARELGFESTDTIGAVRVRR